MDETASTDRLNILFSEINMNVQLRQFNLAERTQLKSKTVWKHEFDRQVKIKVT